LAEEKTEIVIDRNDWQGMRTAVIAELKSSKIATLVLTAQLVYIDGAMKDLPIVELDLSEPKKDKDKKPAGVG